MHKISTKYAMVWQLFNISGKQQHCSVIEASDCLLIKEAINPLSTAIILGVGD